MNKIKNEHSILERNEVVSPWQQVKITDRAEKESNDPGASYRGVISAYAFAKKTAYETNIDDPYSDSPETETDMYFENLVATVNAPVCTVGPGINKIGFEFDLLYSISSDFKKTTDISDKVIISHHEWDDNLVAKTKGDGFKLSVDGNKIEIATKPFELNDTGRKEMQKTFVNIQALVDALKARTKDKGLKVDLKKDSSCNDCPSGKGVMFETKSLSKFVAGTVNDNSVLKIKDAFISPNHFILPLNFPQRLDDYFTKEVDVNAVLQATLGLPLSAINQLVDLIKATEGKSVGIGLTGKPTQRLGLRSDALFNAQFRVNASRAFFLKQGSFNGVTITDANFSDSLTGFLILLLEYLWTSVLPVDTRDREIFSKAYIPLHSKTRFREMFHCLLTKEEQEVFVKVYWENDNWKNLFSLTKKIPGREGGYKKIDDTPGIILFPPKVVLPRKGPEWKTFVKAIVENDFAIEDTDASGNQTLVSGPTSALKLKTKAVIVELRRMGFGIVGSGSWEKISSGLFDMAVKLNA